MSTPVVYVVEDDPAVRDGLSLLFESAGLMVQGFESAEAFLSTYRANRPGCLVLDLQMGGMTGLQLQAEIARLGGREPIIFLTAHVDPPTAVSALQAGAVDFLIKPIDGTLLLDRVREAIAKIGCEPTSIV